MTDSDHPGRVAMAQRAALHEHQQAEFYRQMAAELGDVLWEIILALRLPPEAAADLAGKTTLFGMYDTEAIISHVRELVRGPIPTQLVIHQVSDGEETAPPEV